jgi:hypothetical protein
LLIDLDQPSWTALPMSSRKFELVAPEEIRRAILFGCARVTYDLTAAVEPHRDAALLEGYLASEP